MSNLVQIVAPLFRIDRRMSFWATLATIVMGVALLTANALKWGQQMAQVPVTEGVFTWPSETPQLIGARCVACDNHMFPGQSGCPRCTGDKTEEVLLGRRGTLWTWTIQGFPPKAPPYAGDVDVKTFQAFGVGYVELPGQVKVEARLTVADPEKLKIGMEMEMVIIPLTTDADGNEVVTFAFAPVA